MDRATVLTAYDRQIRQHPDAEVVEATAEVVRCFDDDWGGVTWSSLDADLADTVIRDQVERFSTRGTPWEWKLYSYDQPPDLGDRLAAAGFVAGPPETLMVVELAELAEWARQSAPPQGVELREVVDRSGADDLVTLQDEISGGDHSPVGDAVLAGRSRQPPTAAAFVAYADDRPVSSGRLELTPGTDFAGLWGGGTLPQWRGRGLFRALVARRAALAAERGFRYLQVDASAASRPILSRLGFVELATTTPYVFTP